MTLKNMKFKIDSPEQSAELQKVLFEMGYFWSAEPSQEAKNLGKPYLYSYAEGILNWGEAYSRFEEITNKEQDTVAFIEAHNERKTNVTVGGQLAECVVKFVGGELVETPVAIDAHYSFNYTLSQEDIDMGYIKVDPYFVSNTWKLGKKDDTGVVFHLLKTLARFGDKNTKEREIVALYKSVKRLAQLEGVDLEGV